MGKSIKPIPQFYQNHFLYIDRNTSITGIKDQFNAHQGIELLFIWEGTGRISVNQKIHAVGPGTLFICQPYQLHYYKVDSYSVRTPLIFDPYLFEKYATPFLKIKSILFKLWKSDLERQLFHLTEEESFMFKQLLSNFTRRLNECWSGREQTEELILFLFELLPKLNNLIPNKLPPTAPSRFTGASSRHVEQIMQWIEQHYHEEFSLERLASSLHLSPHHVSHLFSRETGSTLSQYIMARRLSDAISLLLSTDYSVEQIGKQVGFRSPSFFCKCFKEKTGLTPHAYRTKFKHSTL